jgi:hypothetical protein
MTAQLLLDHLPRPRAAGERVGVRGPRPASDIPLTLALCPKGREGMERT